MANQQNFKSDIQTLSTQYIKYSVSRIFNNGKDNLLKMEVPVPSSALLNTDVEINFYSLFDNSLVYSDVIPAARKAISTEVFQYTDGTFKTLLFIDFTKLTDYGFPVGQYQLVLNFTENEIGSHIDQPLKVSNISPSGLEIELEYINEPDIEELKNFASPQINKTWIYDAMKQIFNQPNNQQSNIPTITTPLDMSLVSTYMTSDMLSAINKNGITDTVTTSLQSVLDTAYQNVIACIDGTPINDDKNHMVIDKSTKRFTQEMLMELIITELQNAFSTLQQPATFNII
jgi:hypothetical protein